MISTSAAGTVISSAVAYQWRNWFVYTRFLKNFCTFSFRIYRKNPLKGKNDGRPSSDDATKAMDISLRMKSWL
ncbi:hypothetical protein BsWGS_27150 [Bradybaena similaris]